MKSNILKNRPIIIVGAGISGLTLSILMSRRDRKVILIEKRSPFQSNYLEDARSFNMTISERGMKCFREIGMEKEILKYAVPIRNRMIHFPFSCSSDSYKLMQTYGSEKEDVVFSIKRNDLISILYEELVRLNRTEIFFDSELIDIDREKSFLTVRSLLTEKESIFSYEFVVGADGVYSKTRDFILSGQIVDFQMKYFTQIYKKFAISTIEAKSLKLEPRYLHIFPQKDSVVFMIPNHDQSFSGIYCCEFENPDIHLPQFHKNMETKFRKDFPLLFHGSQLLRKTLKSSKMGGLVSVNLSKWSYEDKIILIGDAAHGVYPFYGQGMNAAVQDCQVLSSLLVSNESILQAFSKYETMQKTSTHALAELCQSHFYYLSRKSLSPLFEGQRRVDHMLMKLKIFRWYSEYHLVAQTDLPYDKIMKMIKKQNLIRKLSGIFFVDYMISLVFFLKWNVFWGWIKMKTLRLHL